MEENSTVPDVLEQAKVILQNLPERPRTRMSKLEKLQCWPQVHAMLESGDSIDEIVTYIQVTREEYTEVPHNSLRRVVYYWISKHPEMVSNRLPTTHLQLESSAPTIDPLAGLNMILAIQMDRISGLYNIEKDNRTYNYRTEKEIRLAKEILSTIADLESKRKRYAPPVTTSSGNTLASQIDHLRQIYTNKYGQAVARVVLSDESRRKVLNALEHIRNGDSDALKRILDRNEKKAVELEKKEQDRVREEGAYIDVDAEPTT